MKMISVLFAIVGTVIGSGFISGKEIAVFFARFGLWSIPCIFLSFFLFWGIFYAILIKGKVLLQKLKSSKLFFILNLFLCIIFSSAMFAGINNLLNFDNFFINFLIFLLILALSTLIYKKGVGIFNKINMATVPLMIVFLLLLLSSKASFTLPLYQSQESGWAVFYCILYVALNTSNGCVMIASLGENLTRKQKARVSLYSALVLMIMLLFVNIILLQHSSYLSLEMPLLQLFNGVQEAFMKVIIFIGCSTTLFSLVYTSSFLVRGLCNNEFLIFSVSVLLPALLSLLRFGFIVLYLYPLASVMGIFILFDLIFLKGSDDNCNYKLKRGKNNFKF